MKLRCTHNSIRLRTRKSDLEQLAKKGRVQESIHLGDETIFRFELKVTDKNLISAEFNQHTLSVLLSSSTAQQWINSEEVSLEVYHPLEDGEQLHILIEKDFPCNSRSNENNSDTFLELRSEKPEAC